MSQTRLFTRDAAYSILEDAIEDADMDWDRRLTVLEGRWDSAEAACAQFARKPWLDFWPEKVRAKATWGGLYRVEIESAGLRDDIDKFYELTEDNGELQVYQLTGDGAGVHIYASGWNSAILWKAVNVEMGVPKYGILGFSRFKPDAGKNGHAFATPFRGKFPAITPPPWRATGAGTNTTANFPGGWRQVAAPSKLLGGFNAAGLNPLFLPALYRGQWIYSHVEKVTF
jgi:hypothetical protein